MRQRINLAKEYASAAKQLRTQDPTVNYPASNPFTPFEDASELQIVGKAAKGKTGTRVRYWADKQIFIKEADFVTDDLLARARQTARDRLRAAAPGSGRRRGRA